MGADGYSLVFHINQGIPKGTGKDPAWLLYALGTYGVTHKIETAIIPLLIIQTLLFTRIIGYTYIRGNKRIAIFLLIFIACAPHAIHYASSLYADSIFCLAFIVILFELWLILKNERATPLNLAIIAILIPIAGFFKGNGIIVLAPIFYTAYYLKGWSRWFLIIMTAAWVLAIFQGGKIADAGKGHGALEPLILFETANFMQTRPMHLREYQHMVTDETKKIMHRYASQEDIDKYYDRDYWDTLWHQNQDHLKFYSMTKEDRLNLRKEFFTYNLWKNLPAFISSRVNIFLASALAQGGMVDTANARDGLRDIETNSEYNPFGFFRGAEVVKEIFNFSYDLRFLLWTPFLGIILLSICIRKSICLRDRHTLIICGTLLVQFIGILIFSIAAEYRYLLVFFYAPLLLFPIFQSKSQQHL